MAIARTIAAAAGNAAGPALVSVPNVVNTPQNTAESTLAAAGLASTVIGTEPSLTIIAGNVTQQTPTAGTMVPPGTNVDLTISEGTGGGGPLTVRQARATPAGGTSSFDFPFDIPTLAGAVCVLIQARNIDAENIFTISPGDWSQIVATDPSAARNVEAWISTNVPEGTTEITVTKNGNFGWMGALYELPSDAEVASSAAFNDTAQSPLFAAGASGLSLPADSVTLVGFRTATEVGGASAIEPLSGETPVIVYSHTNPGQNNVHWYWEHAGSHGANRGQFNSAANVSYGGAMVNLTGSSGGAFTTVPNVRGMTTAAATTEIENVGLTVGTTTNYNHATVPSGSVIDQDPEPFALVMPGSSVNLEPSIGPNDVSFAAAACPAGYPAGLNCDPRYEQHADVINLQRFAADMSPGEWKLAGNPPLTDAHNVYPNGAWMVSANGYNSAAAEGDTAGEIEGRYRNVSYGLGGESKGAWDPATKTWYLYGGGHYDGGWPGVVAYTLEGDGAPFSKIRCLSAAGYVLKDKSGDCYEFPKPGPKHVSHPWGAMHYDSVRNAMVQYGQHSYNADPAGCGFDWNPPYPNEVFARNTFLINSHRWEELGPDFGEPFVMHQNISNSTFVPPGANGSDQPGGHVIAQVVNEVWKCNPDGTQIQAIRNNGGNNLLRHMNYYDVEGGIVLDCTRFNVSVWDVDGNLDRTYSTPDNGGRDITHCGLDLRDTGGGNWLLYVLWSTARNSSMFSTMDQGGNWTDIGVPPANNAHIWSKVRWIEDWGVVAYLHPTQGVWFYKP